jgi:L-malate glycosyltransferase
MRILYIAPGDNPHTWKWVGWFGSKYPGEIGLLPYISPPPEGVLDGVEIITPHIPLFKIASWGNMAEGKLIQKIVRSRNPKLLHALWAYGSGTYAAGTNYHPFLLSPWGSDITVYPVGTSLKKSIQRRFIVNALKRADRVTATSNFLFKAIQDLVPQNRPREIFPYGVDTSVFNPDATKDPLKFEWPSGAPDGSEAITVGFFKSLELTYGPDILLSAIALVSRVIPGIRCVIGGSGDLEEKLRRDARKMEIGSRVCFSGRIAFNDMPRAIAGIDIFAMPSRYEVFGVAALEASAMKKPVVASRKWGIVEVVQDNVTGYLVEPENPIPLAKQIVKLCRERDLRAKLGESGRNFVKENFEFNEIMERADQYCTDMMSSCE